MKMEGGNNGRMEGWKEGASLATPFALAYARATMWDGGSRPSEKLPRH